ERYARMRERETPLVRAGVSPHAPYTVSDPLYRATTALARELAAPVAVHIAESELETELVARGAGAFADGLRKRGIAVAPRARSRADARSHRRRRARARRHARIVRRRRGSTARARWSRARCGFVARASSSGERRSAASVARHPRRRACHDESRADDRSLTTRHGPRHCMRSLVGAVARAYFEVSRTTPGGIA